MKNTGTLKVALKGDREVVLTRVFNAPRAMVYDALTKPELIRRWFGPHGWNIETCEVDLRVGGKWRYTMKGPGNQSMGMYGEYRQLNRPDGLVHTENFDDFPGEAIVTTQLIEENGKTTLIGTVLSATKEIRDNVVASGMEHGAAETYDRLADLLAAL